MEEAARSLGAATVHRLPADRAAEHPAGHPLRLRPRLRPRARRDRLDRPRRGGHAPHARSLRSTSSTLIQDGQPAQAVGRRDRAPRRGVRAAPRLRRPALLRHEVRTCLGGSACARWRSATWCVILLAPLVMVFYRTFQNGLEPVWQALSDPNTRARVRDHADRGGHRRSAEHGLRRCSARSRSCAAAFAARGCSTPSSTFRSRSRPSSSASALFLLYAPRGGWFGSLAVAARVPGPVRDAGDRARDDLRLGAVRRPRGDPDPARARQRAGAGRGDARRDALAAVLADHAALDPLGRRSTASSSRRRAASASTEPSLSSRARIEGKTETATTRIDDLSKTSRRRGAYAIAVVLAVIAVLVLVADDRSPSRRRAV